MSMADDHTFRSLRSNDPYRRAEPSRSSESSGANDPLAELARLIGQSDPLAELGRTQRPASPASYPRDDYAAPARPDWPPREHYGADDRRGSSRDDYHAREDYPPAPQPHADDRYYDDRQYDERHYDERHYDERRLASDPHGQHYAAYDQQSSDHGQHYADEHEHDQAEHDQAEHDHAEHDHADGGYYHEDAPLPPHEDELYDDAPRRRNHSGLATALALIGCAMLGTAGAYAYRSYYPNAVQPPPVITADKSTPTKIVPAAGDPQSTKAVQDRMANAGKEQIVTKQEEPVAIKDVGTQAAPRVVLPAPVAPAAAAPAPAPAAAAPRAAAPPGTGMDAKSVPTVRIRPDGTDVSSRPIGSPAPTAAPPATRPAAPATPPAGGPLSLQPQSSEAPAAPAPRARTAAVPSRPADTTTTATAGHVVQLSSQKSEGEAQAVFRSLQAKFPNELGDRKPIIARADLGSKGVVYRTQVGPFSSAAEANKFCASYKSAGGQCFVP